MSLSAAPPMPPLPRTIDLTNLRRSIWRDDPLAWATERTREFYWSKQREIFLSVRDNIYTAVHSCHTGGKSFIASRIVAWFLDCHPPGQATVITSAPTDTLVTQVLWKEIRRLHAAAALPGRTNLKQWLLSINGKEEVVAFGYSPPKNAVSRFVGIHNRFVLVVFDEACGIEDQVWDDARSMISNDDCRFLAIGNPEDPTARFATVCEPGSTWNVIHIDGLKTPNFTDEPCPPRIKAELIDAAYVDSMSHDPGVDHPKYRIKVRGLFPQSALDTHIPKEWITRATATTYTPTPLDRKVIGVDVGGGSDKTTFYLRHGHRLRKLLSILEPDTMKALGHLVKLIQEVRPHQVNIDKLGIGWGLHDRLAEQIATEQWAQYLIQDGTPVAVHAVKVGDASSDRDLYANLRSELWWRFRQAFESGQLDLDPGDGTLVKQLQRIKSGPTSNGSLLMESKKLMRARGLASPDDADACVLTYYSPSAMGVPTGPIRGSRGAETAPTTDPYPATSTLSSRRRAGRRDGRRAGR